MVHIKQHPWSDRGDCVWVDDRYLMHQLYDFDNHVNNPNPKVFKDGTCQMDIVVFHFKDSENVDKIPNQIKAYEVIDKAKGHTTYRLFLKLDA